MKNVILAVLLLGPLHFSFAQTVTTEPLFPRADQPVTITVDVSGTSLDHLSWNNTTNPVWIWTWIAEGCTANCDAPTNVNPATDAQNAAKVTRISTNPDKYQITFTPTSFFNKPASELKRIGLKLKTRDWNENKQTDNNRFIQFYEGYGLTLTSPSSVPVFVDQGQVLTITANASVTSDFSIAINGVEAFATTGATSISYNHMVAESMGTSSVVVSSTDGVNSKEISFSYIVRSPTLVERRPQGIIDGINYGTDHTSVTLGLWAPGKTSVYVVGDFTDWNILPELQMKKDGEHFWIRLTNLVPGQEYAFQYLVDENVRIADPYADKILDPDDSDIPSQIYPDLKPFPEKALNEEWYFNRVSVLQTNQLPYQWQVENFERPAAAELVIYELLVRDFFSEQERSYENLIDTLSYFKKLGINAIELMPVMEFNGNDSWGYNPTFLFAPDKAYGPKNKFKQFIDECHKAGIAVILDIAMNHHDLPNPYVLMDYDFTTDQPTINNKWFNVTARHPYNVFVDMNHESPYTKSYLDTVNHYWLNEYKVDGFRFDLSKGFTQNNRCSASTGNEGCFAQRDDSRIAILKRMADKIWSHTPQAFVILEHFADNSEETELSNYGMMLWGNLNSAYSQNSLGLSANSDIGWISYKNRNWTNPHVIGYMESHDEERIMVRNLQNGNSSGSYSIKDKTTALNRIKAAAAFFYTIPGPKMLWQFGELGYDISINENGRVGAKPVKWDYYQDPERAKLFLTISELIRLRTTYPVFRTHDFTIDGGSSLIKQITLKGYPYNPSPASSQEMNVVVVGNFDVIAKTVTTGFPHNGNWYHHFSSGQLLQVSNMAASLTLVPGEFRIYTDVKLDGPEELMPFVSPAAPILTSALEEDGKIKLAWLDRSGEEIGYKVYRRKKSATTFTSIALLDPSVVTFTDVYDLEPLVEYEYYVAAINSFGESTSNVASVATLDAVVAVEEDAGTPVTFYPNPVHDLLTIRTEENLQPGDVAFHDIAGARVEVPKSSPGQWDVSSLHAGIYIAEIRTSRGSRKIRIVKL